MASDVKELVAFLASPSDLEEERVALAAMQAELNAIFDVNALRIRIVGWEQVPPDLGRPQGQINPMVESCDIFIGMLKRRWGSPSGEADSGFLEEFELARDRRGGADSPVIALFFADLEQHEYEDPGEGIKRVLAFKKKVQSEFTLLYKTFSSTEDLCAQVKSILVREMVKFSKALNEPEVAQGSSGIVVEQPPPTIPEGGAILKGPRKQIADTLDYFLSIAQGGEVRGAPDRDRLTLIGTAMALDGRVLPTHLTNRLYQRRDELDLASGECDVWFETLLEDIGQHTEVENRVIPGWGAIEYGPNYLRGQLLAKAQSSNSYVARGATATLARLNLRPPMDESEATADAAAETDVPAEDVVTTWVKILNADGGHGSAFDLLLQDLVQAAEPNVRVQTEDLLRQIVTHRDLNRGLTNLVNTVLGFLDGNTGDLARNAFVGVGGNAIKSLVEQNISSVEDSQLLMLATQTEGSSLKHAALAEVLDRGVCTSKSIAAILGGIDRGARELLLAAARVDSSAASVYLGALKEHDKTSGSSRYLEAQLMALTTDVEDLRSAAATPLVTTEWAALSYADPESLREDAREVLRTDGAVLRARVGDILDGQDELVDFLVAYRLKAAASLLTRLDSPQADDIDLVIKYVKDVEKAGDVVFPEVWEGIENLVSDETLPQLIQGLADVPEAFAYRMLSEGYDTPLAPVLYEMFKDSDSKSQRNQAEQWWCEQHDRTEEELSEAIYYPAHEARMAALRNLIARWDTARLVELLNAYPNAGREYWYNIIAALDEHIYLPT